MERQRTSRIGSTCTGTTANIAEEAERTNSAAMTLAVTAFVDATMALIVVFSSIVLPPVIVPRPLSVTETDAGLSVHMNRRTPATQISQQQLLSPTKQLFRFPSVYYGFEFLQYLLRRLENLPMSLRHENARIGSAKPSKFVVNSSNTAQTRIL